MAALLLVAQTRTDPSTAARGWIDYITMGTPGGLWRWAGLLLPPRGEDLIGLLAEAVQA
jgi:hypothetical protein